MKVKIIGAGSIGNHLAQASRRMGWEVTVVDRDPEALRRMKEDLYPKRYGSWDDSIKLVTSDEEPRGGFDIICVGTPPDVRMGLAIAALEEKPKILQLEKPLCAPSLDGLSEFLAKYNNQKDTIAITGYDHAISGSINEVIKLLEENLIGEAETIDVEFRIHWQAFFDVHPWLSGPQDSYLGFWRRGGGSSSEHSHALHLWQLLAEKSGLGKWIGVNSVMEMKEVNGADYDSIASFSFITDKGKVGRVVQDVITLPVKKWARIQGNNGFIEWFCDGHPKGDLIRYGKKGGEIIEKVFEKTRPDDFYLEVLHFKDILDGKIKPENSPMSLKSGVAVMRVLAIAHKNRNRIAVI